MGAIANAQIDARGSIENRLQALWDMSGPDIAALAWKMPNEERKKFLGEFNNRLFAGKWGPPDSFQNGDPIRLRLGDRQLTRDMVRTSIHSSFDLIHRFSRSASPIVIEYLAPHMFLDEEFSTTTGTDVPTNPVSFTVSSIILKTLQDSPAFGGEVTNWARRQKSPDADSERAELRQWWIENKAHFEKEDYKAVKPGRDMRNYFDVIDENRSKAGLPPLYSDVERKPVTEPLPGTRISAEVPRESAGGTGGAQAASDSERPIETGRNWTLLAALCAAGAAVALVMRHLLGKKRHQPR